jgi:hypothetical protein
VSLAGIMDIDRGPGGLDRWGLSHAEHHQLVSEKLNSGANPAGVEFYILNPIDPHFIQDWLLQHQKSHDAINAALGVIGNDLQAVDFRDRRQVRAWLDLNFAEHSAWVQGTGVT